MKSTEYFMRVAPLVARVMIPSGGCLCLGGGWQHPLGHTGVCVYTPRPYKTGGKSVLIDAHVTWCSGLQAITVLLGKGVQTRANSC